MQITIIKIEKITAFSSVSYFYILEHIFYTFLSTASFHPLTCSFLLAVAAASSYRILAHMHRTYQRTYCTFVLHIHYLLT